MCTYYMLCCSLGWYSGVVCLVCGATSLMVCLGVWLVGVACMCIYYYSSKVCHVLCMYLYCVSYMYVKFGCYNN